MNILGISEGDRVRARTEKKMAILASQFPETHETFILRELLAMKQAGIPFLIYSFKACRDKVVHPEAEGLLDQTIYVTWKQGTIWLNAMLEILSHPLCSFKSLLWAVRFHLSVLTQLLKNLGIWVLALSTASKMRAEKISHIHAHWATAPTTAAVVLARHLKISFTFTAHAWDIFMKNPSLKEKVGLAAKVITCTKYNQEYLVKLCPSSKNKILLNYHGVNTEKFRSVRRADFQNPNGKLPLFLTVGRFVETKGYPVLIEAYKKLRSRDEKFQAVFVGEGKMENEIQNRIRLAGLEDSVTCRKSLSQGELRNLYQEADAFVLPSVIARNGDRDGIPNVILEAMSMGLAVVSTGISGIPEAVKDKDNGWIAAEKDADSLCAALLAVIHEKDQARRMGLNARKWMEEKFNDQMHMQSLVSIMRDLV